MENNDGSRKLLRDYATPTFWNATSRFQRPISQANHFEIESAHKVNTLADLRAKLEVFLKNRECEFCGGAHESTEYQLGFFFMLGSPRSRKPKQNNERATVMAATGELEHEARGHQALGHKSLLQSDALYQYVLETSVYPREAEPLKQLRKITTNHPGNSMSTTPDENQFLNMLLKLINAKKTMEIGVFTGYSLLATALALPDDGKILAMDVNRENYELGLPIIQKAGVAHKIDFREGPALPVLDQLLEDDKNHGTFDFVFVDADKNNYLNYHKRLIELVKVGGLVAYDNTLWNGSVVAPPNAPLPEYVIYYRQFVLELNRALAVDPRIDLCMLSVGDGITLCRRIK